MTRKKDAKQIREDALAMAQKKAETGCAGCAAAYLDVAREHGATDEDVARAIDQAPALSRAALLRASLGAAATVAAASLLPQLHAAAAASLEPGKAGTELSPSQVAARAAGILANPPGKALAARIEQRGYTFTPQYSRGFEHPDGHTTLILIFTAPGTKQFAQLVWIGQPGGQQKMAAEEITFRPDMPRPRRDWTAQQAREWINQNVTAMALGRFDGSTLTEVTPNDFQSCLLCVVDASIEACGFIAFDCIGSGPLYFVCLLDICGAIAYFCLDICYGSGACP
jgi:hypothetical protein